MMPVTLQGDYPEVERRITGFYSLDNALSDPLKGQIGIPLRTMYEIYGPQHCGKSTLSYRLAGLIQPTGTIEICDLEGLNPEYVAMIIESSDFDGFVHIIEHSDGKKPRPHESMIQELATRVYDADVPAGVFDSVSAFQPIAEHEGDIGEAFVGMRAKRIAQFSRRAVATLRDGEVPSAIFVVNHVYAKIGGRGSFTAGGEVLGNLAGVRIKMWRSDHRIIKDSEFDDFIVTGKIEKLRYGGKGRDFKLCYVAGRGIHKGMSALADGVDLGIVTRSNTVKIGETSHGYLRHLIDDAREGNDEKFEPFLEALADYVPEV